MLKDELNNILVTKGITKKELAKELGVSYGAVLRYINEETVPSPKVLMLISVKYGIPLENIMDNK